jgi:hypothetical protein
MGKKSKNGHSNTKHIVSLDVNLKERIIGFSEKNRRKGTRGSSIPQTLVYLAERGLEYESLNIQ